YKDHPCIRECVEGEPPRTCMYYFLVEHYSTLSAACYDCPSNASDCSLPQCIPGAGLTRPVLSVNRMVPGPALHVCQGDKIEVVVDNRMELGEGTTIHWHGIRQKGTPYMDGVSMITQCPITKWSKMKYRSVVR
ncbi:L-ascorbate oxidase, partial [Elysia marginata]